MGHKRTCTQFRKCAAVVRSDKVARVGRCTDGSLALVAVGGISYKTIKQLTMTVDKVIRHVPAIHNMAREGFLFGVGHAAGTCEKFPHSAALLKPVKVFLDHLMKKEPTLKKASASLTELGLRLQVRRAPSILPTAVATLPTAPTILLSKNLIQGEPRHGHPPPDPVADILGVPGCGASCPTCRGLGHHACPGCCLHLNPGDKSLRLVVSWQTERLYPIRDRAFYIIGNQAYVLDGGVAAWFDARFIVHGLWSPRGPPPQRWPDDLSSWYHCEVAEVDF